MIMFCTEFIYDGISSREYNLWICSFDDNKNGSSTAGSHIEYTTFKAPNSNAWIKTGSSYNEQLTFTFQVCKYHCPSGGNAFITERELAFIMRWLVRKDYKYLSFIQEGYEDIYYYCQLNVEKYEIAGQCAGLIITAVCDAPFGWSDLKHTTISSPSTKIVYLYDGSDEIGFVYPSVTITSKAAQNIEIRNDTIGTSMVIKNCVAGEQINIENMQITSSEYSGRHKTLYKDFNWKWLPIGNTFTDRRNCIIVYGNCEIEMSWRVPRKAVV